MAGTGWPVLDNCPTLMAGWGHMPSEERFWSYVDRSGTCWEWQAYRDPGGYGRVTWDRPGQLAHRVAAELAGLAIDGLEVCHSCDNPGCVRPDHLFVGDRSDNARDAASKGRLAQQKVTHCPSGHPYDEANTRRWHGNSRSCYACWLERQRERRRRARTIQNFI